MSFPLLLALLSLPPGWSVVAEHPAADAIAHAGAVVALDPDFRHVVGFEMRGGQRWRTRYQQAATGIQALQVRRGAVLLFAGPRMRLLDVKTGKAGRWQTVPAMGTSSAPGCWLNEAHGALAYGCACGFQFVSPAAAPVGARYDYFRQCRRPYGGGRGTCGCWGSSGTLIGRAQGLQIASVPTPQPKGHRGKRIDWSQMRVAVNARTGREVWRHPADGDAPASYVNGAGILPDSKGFWSADSRGNLAVFDARTGRLRWRGPPSKTTQGPSRNVWIAPLPGGLIFAATHTQASAFDAQTGAPRWTRAKNGEAVLPRSALDHVGGVPVRDTSWVRLVDDATGAPYASIAIDKHGRIERDAAGDLWVTDGARLRRFTAAGRLLSEATMHGAATLVRGETVVLASTGEGVQAFDAKTLAPLGTVPGRFEIVQLEGAAGPRRVWITSKSGLRLLEIAPPP